MSSVTKLGSLLYVSVHLMRHSETNNPGNSFLFEATLTAIHSLMHASATCCDIFQSFGVIKRCCSQGITKPPEKLTEGDLLSAMDRYGIGTDATVADHIKKQLDRGYALKDNNARFSPTPLGEALISAYRKMDLANLWQPDLR